MRVFPTTTTTTTATTTITRSGEIDRMIPIASSSSEMVTKYMLYK